MKDHRAKGAETLSRAGSYEHYFGPRKPPFWSWLRAVDDSLEDQGRARIPSHANARSWWLEGLTVDQAVKRQLENLESSQEERSTYDV
jgi:hypothetical protein